MAARGDNMPTVPTETKIHEMRRIYLQRGHAQQGLLSEVEA
jgi:hypothetical protein